MAEAEDVITDAARHATTFAQALWRRHRPDKSPASLHLADSADRLDLLIRAAFGDGLSLRTAQEPAPATFLRRWFVRNEPPPHTSALPGTDGTHVWLPRTMPASLPPDMAAERYRVLALVQAMRARRGGASLHASTHRPLLRDLFSLLEAHAADHALIALLPGMAAPLERLHQAALEERPSPGTLPRALRSLERLARAILAAPAGAPLAYDPAELPTLPQAGGSRQWLIPLPANAAQVMARAQELMPLFVPAEGEGRLQRWLWRDAWLGEMRNPAPPARACAGDNAPAEQIPPQMPVRSARLARRPQARQPREDEDDEGGSGAWMVQTAQPHEQAEDPMGMQRPSDRDAKTAAEEFADALSELPEARLVSTSERTKEVLLSDDPPERLAHQATWHAERRDALTLQYPEWNFRTGTYRIPGATVRVFEASDGPAGWLQDTLAERQAMLQEVRRRFELLRSRRTRVRRQLDGDDIDLDGCVEAHADFAAGLPLSQHRYCSERRTRRDLAVMVLIDVSGSTDAWIAPGRRVIDVAREALLLVSVALDGMDAPFAVQAFSGEGPQGVTVRNVKRFHEAYGPPVALRIAGLEPEHYTRAGAALRHACTTLLQTPAAHRLLLLLSDGKPNDIDDYEGRYGIEDVRQAVAEARLQGVAPFCLTVDRHAADYLPFIFGAHHFALLPRTEHLPAVLLDWLRRLLTV